MEVLKSLNVQRLMAYLYKMENRGQSQIVTAVLLILIVIALAVLILNFSTNFVKDRLDGTGCFDAVGQVSFTNSNKYTCFRDTDGDGDHMLLQVHVGEIKDSLGGLLIELGGADTSSLRINDGEATPGVTMFDGTAELKLPGKNEERTYVFARTTSPESVKIYPILSDGQACEASDVLETIVLCNV